MCKSSTPPLFSVRTALVLLLGCACGAAAGTLTFLAGDNLAAAVLAGLGCVAASTAFFHSHIAHDTAEPEPGGLSNERLCP